MTVEQVAKSMLSLRIAQGVHATQSGAVLREYMQFRFQLSAARDAREIVHAATLSSLFKSRRCKRCELLQRAGDPNRLVLLVQWEADEEQENFRGSPECANFFRALGAGVRQLEEAEYRADPSFLLASLGGEQGMLRLVFNILHEVSSDAVLAERFGIGGGEQVARLGLWLIEVLGGAKLYSAASPAQPLRVGPFPEDPLDVEERAQLLELARHALRLAGGRGHSALSALEANLPLYPALPHQSSAYTPLVPAALPAARAWQR